MGCSWPLKPSLRTGPAVPSAPGRGCRPDPSSWPASTSAGGAEVRSGPIVSTDLFYDTAPGTEERWRAGGALAVEMEAATLFALAARHGFEGGAALIVSDLLLSERRRIGTEALRAAEHALGELAVRALPV